MNYNRIKLTSAALLTVAALPSAASAPKAKSKPNIVVLFADDISAREFPIYNSNVWTGTIKTNTQDVNQRASTPVMDMLANKGCWISTCWSCTVSSPSRAQMMTGRYATNTKWWHNADCGTYENPQGKQEKYPLYESSPMMIGKIAQDGGYGTYWAGKAQMDHIDDCIDKYGFDEACYSPDEGKETYTDFRFNKIKGEPRNFINADSGSKVLNTYNQSSYYWMPAMALVNDPSCKVRNKLETWPNTPEAKAKYGLNTFAPDVEQEFVFNFMDRKQDEGKPFFIYHTTHLGHGAYNFTNPDNPCQYPETPKIEWTGKKYIRTEPNITGDRGVYDYNNSTSGVGIHNHINYIDYLAWRYIEKFKEMGVADNTIFIITADNGTSKYGKSIIEKQKGTHVPMIIYAPCLEMTKQGKQTTLANLGDVLPTIAEIVGVDIPADYQIDGESILPFLTTKKSEHRDFIYSYRSGCQMIRGTKLLRDGYGNWFDVTEDPADLISFPQIESWSKVSPEFIAERDMLNAKLKEYNQYDTHRNGPGGTSVPVGPKALYSKRLQKQAEANMQKLFR
ncbi:MAG: sulfatase-like hydrolase/transferase [Rikenellaceae bacterium]